MWQVCVCPRTTSRKAAAQLQRGWDCTGSHGCPRRLVATQWAPSRAGLGAAGIPGPTFLYRDPCEGEGLRYSQPHHQLLESRLAAKVATQSLPTPSGCQVPAGSMGHTCLHSSPCPEQDPTKSSNSRPPSTHLLPHPSQTPPTKPTGDGVSGITGPERSTSPAG